MTRTVLLLICVLLVPALTGCPKGDANKTGAAAEKSGEAAEAKKPEGDGGATPKELWEKVAEAAKAKDFDMPQMAKFCTRDSQEFLMFPYMFMMGFAMMGKKGDEKKKLEGELEEIFKKHGLSKEEMEKKEKGKKVDMNDPEAIVADLKPKLAGCKDLPALFVDLSAFVNKLSKKNKKMDRKPEGGMKDIKEEGDVAHGQITWKMKSGKEKTEAMYMRKVDGLWYIDIIASEKAKKAAKAAAKTGK